MYKIPTNPDSVPPPVPPPPLPKRSLRASFVRRGSKRQPNVQQPSAQPAAQPAAQPVPLQVQPQPQPRTTQHHYMQLPPQPPAQLKMAAPPPPASPGSEQHEYLNLWPSGDPSSDSGSGFGGGSGSISGHMGYSSENAPRNINDVPPLLPARPQRLRQQRDAGKHTSSCSNSSSSSSTSTNSSASPPCMGSGVVSEGSGAQLIGHYAQLQLPPLSTLPTVPLPRRSSVSCSVERNRFSLSSPLPVATSVLPLTCRSFDDDCAL